MLKETIITQKLINKYKKFSDKPKDKGLLEASSESVIVFAKQMLGIELYTWQKILALRIMASIKNDKLSREFVVLTSRQIGKTTFSAIFSLWVAVFNKLPSGTENWSPIGIISITDGQSKKVVREIKKYVRLGDYYCKQYSKEVGDLMDKGVLTTLLDPEGDNNKQTITFKAPEYVVRQDGDGVWKYDDNVLMKSNHLLKGCKVGNRLDSFPPTPSVLGNTFALLYEDECGRGDKFTDEAHDEFLKPTGDAYDAIYIYTSTAWQPSGFFYMLCDPDDTKEEHDYERFSFTIEAIKIENPKQYKKVLKKIEGMREDGKKDEVERAYYCRFVKGESSYFDPLKVDNLFSDDDLLHHSSYVGECDIGVDFGGQVKSKTVITVSALLDGVITRLYRRVYEVGEDDSLMNDLENDVMVNFPNWQRIIPDDCPAGWHRIEQMRKKGWNVEPMSFRTWKVKKFGSFRSMLNRGLVKSFKDDDLKVEMKALEFTQAAVQSNIVAPRGYSDDLIDSFVMSAFFFLEEERGSYKFYTRKGVYGGE